MTLQLTHFDSYSSKSRRINDEFVKLKWHNTLKVFPPWNVHYTYIEESKQSLYPLRPWVMAQVEFVLILVWASWQSRFPVRMAQSTKWKCQIRCFFLLNWRATGPIKTVDWDLLNAENGLPPTVTPLTHSLTDSPSSRIY